MTGSIVFADVCKKFRRGERHDSLRDVVPSILARLVGRRNATSRSDLHEGDFWAVNGVSFEVGAGEALGIIGPNGAGKSTILKLLTRILKPTRGHCEVRGRVGALIEVAAGFHPDLTGRENVFLQGAIVGMKRAEITRKFDQIVDFAGVGEFIDTPVKRYSSGMNARLGFAIAANLDPEVLIIDEVLSVGDASFQARCVARMHELRKRGVPLVFVSHNLPAVLDLCSRAVLLSRGRAIFRGTAADAVQQYRRAVAKPIDASGPKPDIGITGVQMLGRDGEPAEVFENGRGMTIRIGYETALPVLNPGFAIDIHREDGIYCFGINTRIDGHEFGLLDGCGHVDLDVEALQLPAGCYLISAGIHRAGGIGSAGGIGVYDLHERAYPFIVTSEKTTLGLVCLDHTWRHDAGTTRTVALRGNVRSFAGNSRAAATAQLAKEISAS
jgi:lipopolysaccharide transport system ATP-binding protein